VKGADMDWESPEVIWFVTGLILILLEFAIPGLITVFFGIGAWIVALICLIIPLELNFQLLIFIIVSILSLMFLRKWFRDLIAQHSGPVAGENFDNDEFIGEEVVVVEKITPKKHGRVEFRGSTWKAESDHTIPVGKMVRITGKKNITLIVEIL
jgi:membrane protein implicated in regulation of membrane protease activity